MSSMGTRSQQPNPADDDDDIPGGQSVSMSGSMGSPSSRSEQTPTPSLRLNHPDVNADDAGSAGSLSLSLINTNFLVFPSNCVSYSYESYFFMHLNPVALSIAIQIEHS